MKINGQHYQDVFLAQNLLPDIRQYSDFYTFQQDGAPAHCARETVELLIREMPDVTHTSVAVAAKQSGPKSCGLYCMGHAPAASLQVEDPDCGGVAAAYYGGV